MPKRSDGNEQDLRVRPELDAPSLDKDNPFTGEIPEGKDPCDDGHGSQIELPAQPPCGGNGSIELPGGETAPLPDWTDLSEVCPRGVDTRYMNKLLIGLMKNHFARPECIFHENVREFIEEGNDLAILMNTTFSNNPDQLPSIVVKRGKQKMQRVVMGDNGEDEDWENGEERYTRFVQGSHSLYVTGVGDGFVEDLANEVFDHLNAVSPVIRTDLPLHDFQVTDMTELGIVEEFGNSLAVVIYVVYAYEYSWTIERITPRLARSGTSLDVALLDVTGRT